VHPVVALHRAVCMSGWPLGGDVLGLIGWMFSAVVDDDRSWMLGLGRLVLWTLHDAHEWLVLS
jgi:hypothetical protein